MERKYPFLNKVCLLLVTFLAAQSPFAKGQLNSQDLSTPYTLGGQLINPASLHDSEIEQWAIGGFGELWLGTNTFKIDAILQSDNFIDNSTKQDILNQIDEKSWMQIGTKLGGYFTFIAGNQPIEISFQRSTHFLLEANDTSTVGLILKGNAPYAGKEIRDSDFRYNDLRYQSIGIATAFGNKTFSIGLRPKLIIGSNIQQISPLSYSLLTSASGDEISLKAEYEAYSTDLRDPKGWGLGLDIGIRYQWTRQLNLHAAISNAGLIFWDGLELSNKVDNTYRGVDWSEFLVSGSSTNLALGDTLEAILFPDSASSNFTTSLPGVIHIGFQYFFENDDEFSSSINYGFTQHAPRMRLPQLSLIYRKWFKQSAAIGFHAYGGGIDEYGLGLEAMARLPMNTDGGFVSMFIKSSNILGLITPSVSQGFGLSGGINLGI